jgi:hypothetical protein
MELNEAYTKGYSTVNVPVGESPTEITIYMDEVFYMDGVLFVAKLYFPRRYTRIWLTIGA